MMHSMIGTPSAVYLEDLLQKIYKDCHPKEWEIYINQLAHIICHTDSSHIAVANLKVFLRARPHLQLMHEALRSELFDDDDKDLPSVLTLDSSNPVYQHFRQWVVMRASQMTEVDTMVARNAMLDLLYRALCIFDKAKAEKARQMQQAKLQRDREMQQLFKAPQLRVQSLTSGIPERGMIGVVDLAMLLNTLSIDGPTELATSAEPVAVDGKESTPQHTSWVGGFARRVIGLGITF